MAGKEGGSRDGSLTHELGEPSNFVASSDQSKVTIPRPTSIRVSRPSFRLLAFGLALLGLCVFAWGLKYKLSLYDPPHAISHHMPAAKLLPPGKERNPISRAEVGRLAGNPIVPGALSILTLVLFTSAAAKLQPGFGGWMRRTAPARIAAANDRWGPCFVRPPPRIR